MAQRAHPAVLLFWIVFAAAGLVYATMLLWSLPAISRDAGGLVPFDLRPTGYGYEEAKTFLSALSPAGTALYRDVQSSLLDTAYPALLAASLYLGICLLAPRRWESWRWALGLIAIPGAIFDYLENSMVRLMLFMGPNAIVPDTVHRASRYTVLKAQFTTLAMSVFLGMLIWWLWRRWRRPETL